MRPIWVAKLSCHYVAHSIVMIQMLEVMSRGIHLLQMCTWMDENVMGAGSKLIFVQSMRCFRMMFICFLLDTSISHKTLDLASSREVGPMMSNSERNSPVDASNTPHAILVIVFQFPFERNLQDSVASMARQYVRSVISSVKRVAMVISPSGLGPTGIPKHSPASPEILLEFRNVDF